MRLHCSLIAVVLLFGCGGYSESDFKPSETTARDALTQGLTAWSEGKTSNALPAPPKGPKLQFVDYQWTAGKRLKSFRVLDESPTLKGSTQLLRVHLEVEGEKPQDTEYYIVGKDPLWIMRDRDFRAGAME